MNLRTPTAETWADAGSRAWETRAACRGQDADLWFTQRYTSTALAICAACPVLDPCRAAVLHRERSLPRCDRQGIIAGLTGAQRHALAQTPDHLPHQHTPPDDEAPTPTRSTGPSHGSPPGSRRRRSGAAAERSPGEVAGAPRGEVAVPRSREVAGSRSGEVAGLPPGEVAVPRSREVLGSRSWEAVGSPPGEAGGSRPREVAGSPSGEAGAVAGRRTGGTAASHAGWLSGDRSAGPDGGPRGRPAGGASAVPGRGPSPLSREEPARSAGPTGDAGSVRPASRSYGPVTGGAGCVWPAAPPPGAVAGARSVQAAAPPSGPVTGSRPAAPPRTATDSPSIRAGDPTGGRNCDSDPAAEPNRAGDPTGGRSRGGDAAAEQPPRPETTPSGDGPYERGTPSPRPRLAPCGTRAAYQRHLRRGEFVDEACRDANARGAGRYRRTGSTRDRTDETRSRAAAPATDAPC
ncbi:WhiB family transcriptional regulator [Streptomyces aquilus]|uniref:WhiB family transcriptional regulator n=1 Tax=Streptomyces aquilus TaxID=2548456 RepID=UPI0037CD35BC